MNGVSIAMLNYGRVVVRDKSAYHQNCGVLDWCRT